MLFLVDFSHFHFHYSLARCSLIAAVIAIDFFLKSFVSTQHQRNVASEMGFK